MFSPPQYPKLLDEGNKQQNKDFEQDVELFLNYIYECKPKRMASGKVLTGRSKFQNILIELFVMKQEVTLQVSFLNKYWNNKVYEI